jgi:hypothetical protein
MREAFGYTGIMTFIKAGEEVLRLFPEAEGGRLTVKAESSPLDFKSAKVALYAGETRIAYAEGRSLWYCDQFMNGLRAAIYKARRNRRRAA